MKKIFFDDFCGLTQAVLDRQKTQHWDICMQPPYKNYAIAFPASVVEDEYPEKNPLYGSFCWYNSDDTNERTEWIKPKYKIGEVVAVAQSYKDTANWALNEDCKEFEGIGTWLLAGWNNKMLVRADLMPHQIRITGIHLSRPQKMSEADCLAEGVVISEPKVKGGIRVYYPCQHLKQSADKVGWGRVYHSPRLAFAALIDKVLGEGTWDRNPFVFVYDFELVK